MSHRALRKGVELLDRNQCKKIIAISENAKGLEESFILKNFPDYQDDILNKLIMIPPSQKICLKSYKEKKLENNYITFTIVGKEFFRKGGMEILKTFDKLINENKAVKLNIISSMKYSDYATKSTKEDCDIAIHLIKKNCKQIHHYKLFSKDEVLNVFKKSHVGMLPTFADSYGYSVLESQANGCPVISTDIRALCEINNKEIGWIINVPKDCYKNAEIHSKEKRTSYSKIIEKNLYEIIIKILANPESIIKKGSLCIEKIAMFHHPQIIANKLEEIYDKAIEPYL